MNFQESLNDFFKGNNPNRIIFDVVNQLLDEFIFFKKFKNPFISEIRFDELRTITYDKMIKEGFKSVAKNAIDDDDAKKRIRYLISQYYDSQYSDANPEIKRLNKDVKYHLNQFQNYFPQVGKSQRTEHKLITISSDFNDVNIFNDYGFAKNEPKKTRLKNVFFAIYEILNEKKSLSYSELINYLKSKLDIVEQVISSPKPENDTSKDEDINDEPIGEDEYIDIDLNIGANKNNNAQMENKIFEDSSTICETSEIDLAISQFLNLCTERQKIIFGIYILKENNAINDKTNPNNYKDKFKELEIILGIGRQTLYNENNKAIENLYFVMKKLELNENQKRILIGKLLNEYAKYFNRNSENAS